jgi:hypothetical protein
LIIFTTFAATFPEAQEAALKAAGEAREACRQATGEESSVYFSMDDHLAAMAARIEPITMLGYELRKAAEELYRLLWPTETLPTEIANLVRWLENAPDRLCDWKASAARAGADLALSFVLSWYEEVDLDRLATRRAGAEDKLAARRRPSGSPEPARSPTSSTTRSMPSTPTRLMTSTLMTPTRRRRSRRIRLLALASRRLVLLQPALEFPAFCIFLLPKDNSVKSPVCRVRLVMNIIILI